MQTVFSAQYSGCSNSATSALPENLGVSAFARSEPPDAAAHSPRSSIQDCLGQRRLRIQGYSVDVVFRELRRRIPRESVRRRFTHTIGHVERVRLAAEGRRNETAAASCRIFVLFR